MIIFERQLKNELHIDFRNKVREDTQLVLKEDENGNIKLDINGQDATLPSYSAAEAGKSLKVNADGSATEWSDCEICVNGIRLNLDDEFKMSADLLKDSEVVASSNVIDLPIESLIIDGRYDAAQKAIILTLQNGQEIIIPVGDLVSGLVSESTFNAHVDNQDIHVTAAKQSYWSAKVEAAVVEALDAKVDTKADASALNGKLDVMPGDEHTAGNAYNLPYYFRMEADADKVVVTAETVTLDGNKTYGAYSMDVLAATADKAGLMSAADKVKVDAAITEHQDISGKADKTEVTAEADRAKAEEAKKVERLTTLSDSAKSYVSNNVGDEGACLKVENSTNWSAVAVNNDVAGGLGAQMYDWKMNGSSYESGTVLDVTDSKIYYYAGAYQARAARDVAENEIAVKGDVANKTVQELTNTNGKSLIMNESDGGGVFFIKDDSTSKSFIGVNDSTAGGPDAQIYAINPSNSNYGAKLDILKTGMYYTVGSASYSDRIKDENKLAVQGDLLPKLTATEDGTYALKATISDGILVYKWVKE